MFFFLLKPLRHVCVCVWFHCRSHFSVHLPGLMLLVTQETQPGLPDGFLEPVPHCHVVHFGVSCSSLEVITGTISRVDMRGSRYALTTRHRWTPVIVTCYACSLLRSIQFGRFKLSCCPTCGITKVVQDSEDEEVTGGRASGDPLGDLWAQTWNKSGIHNAQ